MSELRTNRMANLLARGRQLHWQNHVEIAKQCFAPARWPIAAPPVVTLVYKSAQLCISTTVIEAKGYLQGAALDAFSAGLFKKVAGDQLSRVHALASKYAQALSHPPTFIGLVAQDLAHAMTGRADEGAVRALAGAPLAMRKTTELYCADVFADADTIRRLS